MTIGAVLGRRYRLERLLGSGGMAEVYAATDQLLQRPVALKVLRDQVGDPSARARFSREARTLAQLSHPCLVAVLDASTETDPAYLVLELVEGSSLAQALPGPLPSEEVARIGAQVADALAHAHAAGIVHRDVKPGNVLLGSDGRARLTDFGIARLLSETARHTATGLTIGTAAYLAPEQVRGQEVTPAADVYALGLVLIEALTGHRVFSGTVTEALAARLHASPQVPDHLPAQWRTVLVQMTRLDPQERPSSAWVAAALSGASIRGEPSGVTTTAVGGEGTTRALTAVTSPSSAGAPSSPAQEKETITQQVRRRFSTRVLAAAGGAAVLVAATLALATSGVGDNDDGDGRGVPAEVPARYQQPLSDLHDAVNGESR